MYSNIRAQHPRLAPAPRQHQQESSVPRKFPTTRLRRNRVHEFSRRLVAETSLTPSDLIYPVFVIEGQNCREAVASMPGVSRMSVDLLMHEARTAYELGIPALALFPRIDPSLKTADGAEHGKRAESRKPCVRTGGVSGP
ncbi:MAG: hypothetical protein HC809_07250, partial [Gammaproteobacteria bacterium]|nr:hypothetical protein [Gammaproteobacteria bacterium]